MESNPIEIIFKLSEATRKIREFVIELNQLEPPSQDGSIMRYLDGVIEFRSGTLNRTIYFDSTNSMTEIEYRISMFNMSRTFNCTTMYELATTDNEKATQFVISIIPQSKAGMQILYPFQQYLKDSLYI